MLSRGGFSSFAPIIEAIPDTVYTSRTVKLRGYGSGKTVAITDGVGEWSKNGGAWTTNAGTASDGDKIRVRQTSLGYGLATLTLTVDTTDLDFVVTTMSEDFFINYVNDENYTDVSNYEG